MSMTIIEAFALPDEFFNNHCGLCGNSGIIDTTGKMFTAAGVECGIRAACLCANGRAIKRHEAKPLTRHRVRAKPVETFWVSWEEDSWTEPVRLSKNIISAWESGQAGDGSYRTVVAWVAASTTSEIIAAIDKTYPCKGERRWRFINPCERGWLPGDRFPLNARAKKVLKGLK